MMKPRSVKALSLEELEKLTTARLLSYLDKLNKLENSIELSDWSESEIKETDGIVFKSTSEWKAQHNAVKSVLATRPNISK